ncbi:hypothetical protein [Belliella pelovolcani]|uniref:Uncharacterized protein n=1 Tax=Belliella pelovolcani TaxID=529505 RepID=A0A1N7MR70_9BACT|nr:hypothetical protein [Belliella pelovolcani]SIS88626.1 hypothetical protein SAMN05421761_10762 [Belliella pelovolcani]
MKKIIRIIKPHFTSGHFKNQVLELTEEEIEKYIKPHNDFIYLDEEKEEIKPKKNKGKK